MKTLLVLFLFAFEVCYAQLIPHTASITASKDSILADETFNVTYSLIECLPGYIYIGVGDGYFETIGRDRWEGEIKDGETKTVVFTVKLKERAKAGIQEKAPLSIGFSYHPFGERISPEISDVVIITITDFIEMKDKVTKIKKGDTNKVNGINNIDLNFYPVTGDSNSPSLKKTVIRDTTFPKLESLRISPNEDSIDISDFQRDKEK